MSTSGACGAVWRRAGRTPMISEPRTEWYVSTPIQEPKDSTRPSSRSLARVRARCGVCGWRGKEPRPASPSPLPCGRIQHQC